MQRHQVMLPLCANATATTTHTSHCIVWLLISLASLHPVPSGCHKFYFCPDAISSIFAFQHYWQVPCLIVVLFLGFMQTTLMQILSSQIPCKHQSTPASWQEGNNQPVWCGCTIICPCQTCWLLFLFLSSFYKQLWS